jgi:hypothetical protein
MLNTQILRGLQDKLLEKRKNAASELEKFVLECVKEEADKKLALAIQTLADLTYNGPTIQAKLGGLLGLASVGISLSEGFDIWLPGK